MATHGRNLLLTLVGIWSLLLWVTPARAAINGYLSVPSVAQGARVNLHTSTDAASYTVNIYRFDGTYKLVQRHKSVRGAQYPIPEQAWMNGAQWPKALTLRIPEDWPSAIYRVQLLTEPNDPACADVADLRREPNHPNCVTLTLTVKTARPGSQSKFWCWTMLPRSQPITLGAVNPCTPREVTQCRCCARA